MESHSLHPVDDWSHLSWMSEVAAEILSEVTPGKMKVSRSVVYSYERRYRRYVERGPALAEGPEGSATLEAAYLWLLLRTGRLQDAAEAISPENLERCTAGDLDASEYEKAVYLSIASEVLLLSGRTQEAAASSLCAIEYGKASDSPAHVRYGTSVFAAALAVNGQIGRARETLADLGIWTFNEPWKTDVRARTLVIALAFTLSHDSPLDSIVKKIPLRGCRPADRFMEAMCLFGECVISLNRSEFERVVELAESYRHRVDSSSFPALVSSLIVGVEALALIHLRRPGGVLALTEDRVCSAQHNVCYRVLRATAYIQLGKARDALRTTVNCAKSSVRHSLATLSAVLVRRAVAYELLGQHESADSNFSRAARMAFSENSLVPVVGLPMDVIERLLSRFSEKEPARGAELLAALKDWDGFPHVTVLDTGYARLTKRELVLLEMVRLRKEILGNCR